MDDANDRGPFSPDDISQGFWETVERAQHDRNRLQEILSGMSREEIQRFHHEFQEAAIQLTDEPFTQYLGDLSEDDVQDVAEWVVSQGKSYYSEIWNHPDRIPRNVEAGGRSTLSSVADNVFWDRFHQSIPR